MRQSALFTRAEKNPPGDETSKNAELLLRAGFIRKEMAGVYSYLPLGRRVLSKIEGIVRKEMDKIGGLEILMPTLQNKENWQKTGRWESMDDLYKVEDKSGREAALGPTHEENVVPLVASFAQSYKDLPLAVYQIQNKFRAELRAKSGLLRGREFLMKDLYSFHLDSADLDAYYEKVVAAYRNMFREIGIGHLVYLTFASGGSFSKFSHEFQMLTAAGEDTIYLNEEKGIAVNKEVLNDAILQELGLEQSNLKENRAIEVGNIFKLNTKYTDPFEYSVMGEDGKPIRVLMGCYGFGLSRVMGAVVEALADEKGLVWPESVAPFKVHLLQLGAEEKTKKEADNLYENLTNAGVEVLYDDRDISAGEKFAEADLIGLPHRLVISSRSLAENSVEHRERAGGKESLIPLEEVISKFTSHV